MASHAHQGQHLQPAGLLGRILVELNGRLHRQALRVFLVIVLAHLAEHLVQAIQIFVLHWPRAKALGLLGLAFPQLIASEWLHYLYAIVMLVGFVMLRPGFHGGALAWWNLALAIQVWHHFEHALLLGQALAHQNLFGSAVPLSVLQLVFPRVELHLFYNTIVFVPMVVAMIDHRYRPVDTAAGRVCNCVPVVTRKQAIG
ncbi:MAG: hypothetical protein OHK0022_20610 [Roseiflexaceae bacterium]